MLESMVEHSRPTRAEASDVANAVFDGTDAVMLSAETAAGKHPVEAVAMMARIVAEAEASDAYHWGPLPHMIQGAKGSVPEAIGEAAGKAAIDLGARAIAVLTETGRSAQIVAKYRPKVPVHAFSSSEETCRRLAFVWGIHPERIDARGSIDVLIDRMADAMVRARSVRRGDLIVVTGGTPLHVPGTTNFLKIHRVDR
jgi:pyruvate kinase